LDRQQGGTGLGLVLVQKMVEMHGGSVFVETGLEKGSIFTVTLPWVGNIEPGSKGEVILEDNKPVKGDSMKQTGKILLVDDSDLVVITISTFLKNKGYQLNVARNGKEAIEIAQNEDPGLILMDVQMPVMDGLETIHQMRMNPKLAHKKIVVMSALAMPGDRERCLNAGATDYLSKPVSLKQIINTIERYLD
jgi:CheY-like chemotaxis protein